MSMNEQYEQLQRFARELDNFNRSLAASMRELEEQHDIVSPLWQDDMRQSYDREWIPLKETMDRYVQVDSARYMDFLKSKIRMLERYLHGR
ncbi:MAG: hypothetical protein K8L99_35715 [Anaerolineae bacterium]|nr:hypothetical protein [Anaerolineae bacterium]